MGRPPDPENGAGAPKGPDTTPYPIETASCHTGGSGDDDSELRTLGHVTRANPLEGLAAVPCQCWLCRWHRACDKAIDTDGAVRLEGAHSVMIVADTVVAEVAANGGEIPDTYRLMRDDGRTVWVFIDEGAA